jgi:uncharacterized membrane protein YkoI
MKTCLRCGGTIALFFWAAATWADEKKIALADVPNKVMTAVKEKFPGAEITGAEKETEDGKTIYEINLNHKGQSIDAEFSPEGEFLEMEAVIDAKDLPRAVADAIKSKYPDSELKRAEKVTKKDDSVLYEVIVQSGDKKGEVVVEPSGKIVKGLEKKADEKKD